jgi:hypothetical protein
MIRRWTVCGLAVLTLPLLTIGACTLPLSAEAHDEWKRSYQLSQGGSLEIRNTNGQIKVEAGDGNAVEVTATRNARAGSQEDANNTLKRVEITENVSPNRIVLDSSRGSMGFHISSSQWVDYIVRVPKWAGVTLKTTNGEITAAGITGAASFESTNGEIHGSALEGPVRAETTNGDVTIELGKLAQDGVRCRTTNGEVEISLPSGSKASLDVQTNNGSIDTSGIEVAISEKSRRDMRATIGGGGPQIKLETTNGSIRIRGK